MNRNPDNNPDKVLSGSRTLLAPTHLTAVYDLDNLPDPKDLAEKIVENIEAGLNNFRTVLTALGK